MIVQVNQMEKGNMCVLKHGTDIKKKMDLFNELEDNLDSDDDSLMSTDDEKMEINYDGI